MTISEHTYRRRVQFAETDVSGVVHFTNFFKYVEEAEHDMWRAAGFSVAPRDGAIGWPRIAVSFEYRKPLRFEDEIEVRLRIEAKTAKTMRYSADLVKDGEVVASGSLTIICVRQRPGEPPKAIDIPTDIDARFQVAK